MVPCALKSENALPMKFPLSAKTTVTFERPLSPKATQTRSGTLPSNPRLMLPPEAQKKMQAWIRSRHLICEGNCFDLHVEIIKRLLTANATDPIELASL